MFTEQTGNIKNDEICTSDYLSDHASILWTILLEKPKISVANMSFRNWKSVDMNKVCQQLDLNGLDYMETNLHQCLLQFQNRIKKETDEKVPMKTKRLTIREGQLWFNGELRQWRRSVNRSQSGTEASRNISGVYSKQREQTTIVCCMQSKDHIFNALQEF